MAEEEVSQEELALHNEVTELIAKKEIALFEEQKMFERIEIVKCRKLETVKAAIQIIKENNRHKPLNERDISVEDVISMVTSLDNFIEKE